MAVGKTNEGSELPAKPYKEVDERERESQNRKGSRGDGGDIWHCNRTHRLGVTGTIAVIDGRVGGNIWSAGSIRGRF